MLQLLKKKKSEKNVRISHVTLDASHLSLISFQSFAVAANFTAEIPKLLCQLDSLMGAGFFALIFPQLFL